MILFFLILAGLIRWLIATGRPLTCAGLLTGYHVVVGLLFVRSWTALLLTSVVVLALASLYFWILNELETGSLLWWLVALPGMVVLVVARNWMPGG